jgi:hypothetical protein
VEFRPELPIKVFSVPDSYNGVVVGPGFFEAMGELLHWFDPLRTPDEEASHGCTHTTDNPEQALHESNLLDSRPLPARYMEAWMRGARVEFEPIH